MNKQKKSLVILGIAVIIIAAAIITIAALKTSNNNTVTKNTPDSVDEAVSYSLDQAISKKLLEQNRDAYLSSETRGEGHIILETEDNKAYILTSYGEYGFENGKMVKQSGTGIIPGVAYFTENNGIFKVTSIEYPGDGTYFMEDIKKMFPEHLHKRCAAGDYEKDYAELSRQEKIYVREYLKSINRNTEIKEYHDIPHILLTDLGVSVEVSNKLIDIKNIENFYKFPIFIGNCEYIENGERIVYSLDYAKEDNKIIYRRTRYDNAELLDEFIFDATTGEQVS